MTLSEAELAPAYAPFFGCMGAAAAIVFSGKQVLLFSKVMKSISEPVF